MRFGGLIVAAAWIVAITGAAAQTPSAGGSQTPAQATNSEQGNQPEQIHNPDTEAQKAQQKAEQANPANKKPPTAEEEREQKIRQYDPLANTGQQQENQNGQNPQNQNQKKAGQGTNGSGGSKTQNGGEAAGGGLPGPTVDGEADNSQDSSAYSGPAVLSRSYTLLRPSIPAQERWDPFLGVNAIYDSGLEGFQSTATNGYTTGGSFGAELLWGISGRHYFHHDVIGLNYRGDLQHYTPAKYFNGSNHWVTLDYTHMFSRRLSVSLVEAGSIYSQNFTLVNPVSITEEAATNPINTPNVQIFDNGWKQATSGIDVTYQKTARLSFNAGASGFIFRPEASYLIAASGGSAHGDGMYRVTRRTTVGVTYSYNNFWYHRGIGRSRFHTIDGVYSWALGSTMQLHARGGASRLDSSGFAAGYLNPQVAGLVGQGNGITQYRSIQWISDYAVQFTKSFRRSRSASISYNRGLSPGNGLYLTSRQQDIAASGSMILFRHYYFSAGVGYDSLSATAQNLGDYRAMYAFFGGSRPMRHGMQANLRFDFRHFDVGNAPLLNNTFRVTLGLTWSPVEGLHRLW